MIKRWMASSVPLGLLALLGACVPPPCDVFPFGAGMVMKQTGGSYQVPWEKIHGVGSAMVFDDERGEHDHVLQPATSGTMADIAPAHRDWNAPKTPALYVKELNSMGCGQITARVQATGGHAPLGLIKGVNYLVVWRDWKLTLHGYDWGGFHMASVNPEKRMEYANPHYTAHGKMGTEGWMDSTKAKLSVAALECSTSTAAGLKACFVDSDSVWRAAGATPGGAGFIPLPATRATGYFSQPWSACVLFGCCCGGTQCHM